LIPNPADKPKSLFVRWWNLRNAYQALFLRNKPTQKQKRDVMQDLREYCNHGTVPIATDKNGATDSYQTGKLHGRQEVLLYLQQILDLDDATLIRMKEMEDEQGTDGAEAG
jgi:hypothetical protein